MIVHEQHHEQWFLIHCHIKILGNGFSGSTGVTARIFSGLTGKTGAFQPEPSGKLPAEP